MAVTQFLSNDTIDQILESLCVYAKDCAIKINKDKIGIAKKEPYGIKSRLITFILNEQHTYNIQLTVHDKSKTTINIMVIECHNERMDYITDFDFKTLQAKIEGSDAREFIKSCVEAIESKM